MALDPGRGGMFPISKYKCERCQELVRQPDSIELGENGVEYLHRQCGGGKLKEI